MSAWNRRLIVLALALLAAAAPGVRADELVVEDGVVVKFGPDGELIVRDGLTVVGGVLFTSVLDDSSIGPLGSAPGSPAPGDWFGVRFESSASLPATQLEGLRLRYAGRNGSGALWLRGFGAALDGFTVEDSAGPGLFAGQGSTSSLTQFAVRRNDVGVRVEGGSSVSFGTALIEQNTTWGALADDPAAGIGAGGNWWGHPSGPLDDSDDTGTGGLFNPGGLGNAASDGILYDPFSNVVPLFGLGFSLPEGDIAGDPEVAVELRGPTASGFRLSEDPAFPGVPFEPMTDRTTFLLSAAEGLKTVYAQFQAPTGNTATLNQQVRLDTSGPVLVLVSPVEGALLQRPVTVLAQATDPAGVTQVEFLVDGIVVAVDSTNDYSFDWDVRTVPTGAHELSARATDGIGRETLVTISVNVNPTAPAVPVITSPANGTITSNLFINVSGQSEPFTTVSLFKPASTLVGQQAVGATGLFSFLDVQLNEGATTFTAVASDAAGTSAPSAPVVVMLDTGAPDPPALNDPINVGALLRIEWYPPLTETPAFYRLYRSDSVFLAPEPSLLLQDNILGTLFFDNPGADGTFYYGVTAVDLSGNESDLSNVVQADVDVTPPSASITTVPAGPVGPGTVDVTLVASEPLDGLPILGIAPQNGTVTNIDLTATAAQTYTGQFEVLPSTPSGTAVLGFSARDVAGNLGSDITLGATLVIDTDGPRGSLVTDPSGTVGAGPVQLTLTLDEPASGTPELRFLPPTGGTETISLSGGPDVWTGELTITPAMGDGTGSFEFDATDALGNDTSGPVPGAELTLDTTSPSEPSGLTALSRPDGFIALSWNGVPDATAYNVYRLPVADSFPSPSQELVGAALPGTTFDDLPASDGSYRYAASALDGLNNESGLSADAVAVSDRIAPDAPTDLTAALEGSSVRLNWLAPTGDPTDRYRLFRELAPFVAVDGLTQVGSDLAVTTVLDVPPSDGDFYYGVVAVDLAGNVSPAALADPSPFTYDLGDPVITIGGVTDGLVTNAPVTPTYSATDVSLLSVDATLNGSPFVSGTEVSAEDQYTLVVTAEDATGNTAGRTVGFTIDFTDPVITVTGVADGISYLDPVTPAFTVDDAHLDTVTATLNGAPFTSGTPVDVDGAYALAVEAADLAGNVAQVTVNFTVDAPPRAPASLRIELTKGAFPVLSWPASSEPDVTGYVIRRGGRRVTSPTVAGTTFTDQGFTRGARNVYQLAAVDAAGHESPPVQATLEPITLEVTSYGIQVDPVVLPVYNPSGATSLPAPDESDSNVLTRRYLDRITVAVRNSGGSTLTPGELRTTLRDASGPLFQRSSSATGPLAPGGSRSVQGTFPVGTAPELARALDMELDLPSEPGTQVVLKATRSLRMRPTPLAIEVFTDPLVRGAMTVARVKVFNHGSVPVDLLTSLDQDGTPSPEVEVRLLNGDDTVLSSARLNHRGAGTVATPTIAFATIPVGGSYLSGPIPLQVPSVAPDQVFLQGVVLTTHSGILGPDDVLGSRLTGRAPVLIGDPAYLANAQTDKTLYDQGESVLISGQAFDTQTLDPMPDVLVKIGVSVRGFVRYLWAQTDAAGDFQTTFNPFASEAGSYTVWATHPTVTERGAQAQFDILGLELSPNRARVRFSRNGSFSFPVRLKNAGERPLNNIVAGVTGGFGISGSVDMSDVPPVLEPGQRVQARVTLNATPDADLANFATVTFTEDQGAVRTLNVEIALSEAIPVIDTDPNFIDVGLVRGGLKARNIRVYNIGFAPLTGITIDAPSLPWIRLGQNPTLPSIQPGESANITVLFNPTSTVEQGAYTDSIVIRSGNHIPFAVNLFSTVTSAERGTVAFLVKNTENVKVPGASVSVQSAKVPGLVFRGRTDANGEVRFADLPAGPYQYKIQATGHDVAVSSFAVEADTVTPITVFLGVAYVTLEWSVRPIMIEDRYDVTLTATFETSVPAPVLITDPNYFEITLEPGGIFAGSFSVTNYGLVAGDDLTITSAGSPGFVVETLITSMPRIGAMETIEVPFRITLLDDAATATTPSGPFSVPTAAATGGPATGAVTFQQSVGPPPEPAPTPEGIIDCPEYQGGSGVVTFYICLAGFEFSASASVSYDGGTFDPLGICDLECDPCNCAIGSIGGVGLSDLCKCVKGIVTGGDFADTACSCLGSIASKVGDFGEAAIGAACNCIKPAIQGDDPWGTVGACLDELSSSGGDKSQVNFLGAAAAAISTLGDAFKCGLTIGLCMPDLFDFESSPYSGGGTPIQGGGGGSCCGGGTVTTWSGCN